MKMYLNCQKPTPPEAFPTRWIPLILALWYPRPLSLKTRPFCTQDPNSSLNKEGLSLMKRWINTTLLLRLQLQPSSHQKWIGPPRASWRSKLWLRRLRETRLRFWRLPEIISIPVAHSIAQPRLADLLSLLSRPVDSGLKKTISTPKSPSRILTISKRLLLQSNQEDPLPHLTNVGQIMYLDTPQPAVQSLLIQTPLGLRLWW